MDFEFWSNFLEGISDNSENLPDFGWARPPAAGPCCGILGGKKLVQNHAHARTRGSYCKCKYFRPCLRGIFHARARVIKKSCGGFSGALLCFITFYY